MAIAQSHTSISLLIVEDDKTARDVIARMVGLKFSDCTIYTAENGRKGLELFKEHIPDMVITDIQMPEMNGIEMSREIRSINAITTFIVLTAYDNKNFLEEYNNIGYCAYLMKPVDFKELFEKIEKCGIKLQLKRE